jgi:hypothetical protein
MQSQLSTTAGVSCTLGGGGNVCATPLGFTPVTDLIFNLDPFCRPSQLV